MIHITQDGAVCVLRKRNVGGQPDTWREETEGEKGNEKLTCLSICMFCGVVAENPSFVVEAISFDLQSAGEGTVAAESVQHRWVLF